MIFRNPLFKPATHFSVLAAVVMLSACGGASTAEEGIAEASDTKVAEAYRRARLPPTLKLAAPTAGAMFTTTKTAVDMGGTASDFSYISSVKWKNDKGASGIALLQGTQPNVTWSAKGVPLSPDLNTVTVTATNSAGKVSSLAVAVTVAAAQPPVGVDSTYGTLFHVRTDGGTGTQCDGKSDLPYPGSGTGLKCAWKSPMIALPPIGSPRIVGGDALLIHAGKYMVGLGAPGADGCSSSWPWDCVMAAVPSGPDAAHPTRILGEGHDAACPAAPQLWGTERAGHVLSLKGASNVEVSCLELTDHAPCVEFHTGGMTCKRDTYPYGAWSPVGLYAVDSSNIEINDLNVHGLAVAGVVAGRIKDWTVKNLRVAGNGWVGWNGDVGGTGSSNTGTLRFSKWLVEWNGCAETYPGNQPTGCWAQEAGGYGDGVGTGATAGDWIIEDSTFRFNTSDGLDLLYHNLGGTITLNRVWAEGNAGNQLKVLGNVNVTNSVVIGTCGFFNGKSFSYKVDDCRAAGDTLAASPLRSTDVVNLVNNTIVSEGNVAVLTGGPAGSVVRMRNNIIVGLPMFAYPAYTSADTYVADGGVTIDETHSIKQTLRNVNCSRPSTLCTTNAGLTSATRTLVDPRLTTSSVARDSGVAVGGLIPGIDYFSKPRPAGVGVDRGAVEAQ